MSNLEKLNKEEQALLKRLEEIKAERSQAEDSNLEAEHSKDIIHRITPVSLMPSF